MTSSTTDSLETPRPGRYVVDVGKSTVSFTTRHMFGLAGVKGTFTLREAEFTVGDPVETTTLRAVIDAASFQTGTAKRDADVNSAKFLDTAKFPDITVTGSGASMRDGHWVATGTLTARGVPSPLELVLNIITESPDGLLTLRATAKVDRYAHNVSAAKGMAARWLDMSVEAIATRVI